MRNVKFRKAALMAATPVVTALFAAVPALASTPIYSFETLYNASDAADPLGTMPDDFRPSPSPALTSVTQSTIGATDSAHSMQFTQQAGATFTAALTKDLPAVLTDASTHAISFDLTVPATGNFTGAYARIGISAFGSENDSPDPMNPFVDQVQAAGYSEQNIALDPGQTYHVVLPNIMLFNPRTFSISVPFSSCFGPDPSSLTLISWELYVNKSGDSALTTYMDNFQAITSPVGVWNSDGSNNWSNANSWNTLPANGGGGTNIVPNGVDTVVTLNSISVTSARTITMDQTATVGDIEINGAGTLSIVGSSTLSLAVSTGHASINVLKGNHSITAPLQLNSDTTITVASAVNALSISNFQPTSSALTKEGLGAATLNSVQSGALTINNGVLHVAANGTSTGTSRISSLTIAGGATPTASLNLNDNDLIATSSSYSTLSNAIKFARNGGAWDRNGLTSYAARDSTLKNKSLGVISGAQFHANQGAGALFDGFSVANSDWLVKYTYLGDANLNGKVDGSDYSRIDSNFNIQHSAGNIAGWFNGDFNYDGKIDGADYGLIDSSFNSQLGTLRPAMLFLSGQDPLVNMQSSAGLALVALHYEEFGAPYASAFASAVPEPATLSLAILPALIAGRRRRR